MAAKSTVKSGNWTDGDVWGGSAPANGDTYTITAGHTVVYDADMSAWANGIGAGVVNGTLTWKTNAKTVYKYTGSISGSGQMRVGTAESPIISSGDGQPTAWFIANASVNLFASHFYFICDSDVAAVYDFLAADAAIGATELYVRRGTTFRAGNTIRISGASVTTHTVLAYDPVLKKITLTEPLAVSKAANQGVAIFPLPIWFDGNGIGSRFIYSSASDGFVDYSIAGASFSGFISASTGVRHNAIRRCSFLSHTITIYRDGYQIENAFISSSPYNRVVDCIVLNNSFANSTSVLRSYSCASSSGSFLTSFSNPRVFINCASYNAPITFYRGGQNSTLYSCLFSGTEVSSYTTSAYYSNNSYIASFDHNQAPGAFRAWTLGGIIDKVSDVYPEGKIYSYRLVCENAANFGFYQEKFKVLPGGKIDLVFHVRRDKESPTSGPFVQVFNASDDDPLLSGSSPIFVYSATSSVGANTWETFTVPRYVNTAEYEVELVARVSCLDATAQVWTLIETVPLYTDPGKANVIIGSDYLFNGVNQVAEHPTAATSEAVGAAAQLAIDVAEVENKRSFISDSAEILGVAGALDMADYTRIDGVAAASDVRRGVRRYADGPLGEMPFPQVDDDSPDVAEIVRDWICADPRATLRLAKFDFGDGEERPAIFTREPAPKECDGPCATVSVSGGRAIGTRSAADFETLANVSVWGERRGSTKEARLAAGAIYEALRRSVFDAGAYRVHVWADPPSDVSDDAGYPGYSISVRIQLRKENATWP